jgi:hypothetical protein
MARIQFKGKVQRVTNMDDTLAYEYIQVPVLDRKHCDMAAFRSHAKYGGYANSDLFKGMLARIRSDRFGSGMLKLSAIPEGVNVDTSGFLAVVSIEV